MKFVHMKYFSQVQVNHSCYTVVVKPAHKSYQTE